MTFTPATMSDYDNTLINFFGTLLYETYNLRVILVRYSTLAPALALVKARGDVSVGVFHWQELTDD